MGVYKPPFTLPLHTAPHLTNEFQACIFISNMQTLVVQFNSPVPTPATGPGISRAGVVLYR